MSAPSPAGKEATNRAEAFSSHFQAAGAGLWCVAVGVLGTRDEAEDCLQEAAMIAWSKWSEFELGTSFGAWMARIVRYAALNRGRRRGRRRTQPLASAPEPAEWNRPSPATVLRANGALSEDQEAFDDRVVSALRQLGEDARTSLLLRVVAGLDYAEISSLLDMPEGTAMSHVSRAKTRLRKLLSETEDSP